MSENKKPLIVKELEDLIEQAAKERSHYYVKSVAEKAILAIGMLSSECEKLAGALKACNDVAHSYDCHPKGFDVIFNDTKQALSDYQEFKKERGE